MKQSWLAITILLTLSLSACSARSGSGTPDSRAPNQLYSIPVTTLEGKPFDLHTLAGHVVMIANVALGCGTSPQLTDLEAVYQKYKDQGLIVIAVPRGPSKPADAEDIKDYRKTCALRYGITFPILSMGPIGGPRIHPLLDYVTNSGPTAIQGPIDFNFEKFIIDKRGNVRARLGSFSAPAGSAACESIESLLKEPQ